MCRDRAALEASMSDYWIGEAKRWEKRAARLDRTVHPPVAAPSIPGAAPDEAAADRSSDDTPSGRRRH